MFWWQKPDPPEPTEQPGPTERAEQPPTSLSPQPLKPFIQQLYEDESLTGALTDNDAKMLLAWGQAQLERLADESPQVDLDQATQNLRRLLKTINQLIAKRSELSDTDFLGRLLTLAEQWSAFSD
ncbi:MAG: hypothetical protein KDJ65_17320 [Anaerolineae bacterium]|nr:hypothetical protein [Anaerolineae bacterium]